MTISQKYRRRIVVDQRTYLWWVAEDDEGCFDAGTPFLTVASEDRRLLVRYDLQQPEESRHLIVIGPEFRNVQGREGCWRRFRCPPFGRPNEMHPGDVAALIRWCTDVGPAPIEVKWLGLPISVPRNSD